MISAYSYLDIENFNKFINNMFSHKQPKADKEKGCTGWVSNPHLLQSGKVPFIFSHFVSGYTPETQKLSKEVNIVSSSTIPISELLNKDSLCFVP